VKEWCVIVAAWLVVIAYSALAWLCWIIGRDTIFAVPQVEMLTDLDVVVTPMALVLDYITPVAVVSVAFLFALSRRRSARRLLAVIALALTLGATIGLIGFGQWLANGPMPGAEVLVGRVWWLPRL
jgi:hypothetical protein